jgi:threonine dehydrogenase-like Zn-dependent dehydrogenase
MKQSRAAVQTDVRKVEILSFPVPEELNPGFGLLRVEASGMCGTDVSQFTGATRSLGMYEYPAVLGHEAVGYIVALTAEAQRTWGVEIGDRVAVEPIATCGRCGKCENGRSKLCTERHVYGFRSTVEAPSLWGAFSEYMLIHPQSRLHVIPDDIPIEQAVLFNALAGGFEWTVKSAGTQAGDDVVIIGPGLRGIAGVLAAREAGARNIVVIGRGNARKEELAVLFGATHVLNSCDGDIVARVREITGGGGQRIIDFTPHANWALSAAVSMAEPGATIIIVGVKGQPVGLESDQVMYKSLTIKGVNGPDDWGYRNAIDTIVSRRQPLDALSTHHFSFTETESAIRTLAGETGGEPALGITVTA